MVYAIAELISLVTNVIHVLMVFSTFLYVTQVNIIELIEGGFVFDVQKPNPIYFDKPEHGINTNQHSDFLMYFLFACTKEWHGAVQLSKRSFSSVKSSFLT